MHGLVCLDAQDRVLRPAILWNDQRTGAECAEIEERVGLERLISLTGNRALPGFTAPKLLWLRRHEPDVYRRIRRIVLPKDYVRLRLNGDWAIDVADASGTLLFDVAHRRWSDDVLAALEVPHDWLPPVHESTEIAGAGDQQAAALGVGVIEPGIVSVVLGTSGVVLASLPAFAHDREARVHAFCHALPDTWEAMGVMLNAAGSLQWFRDALAPDSSFEELTAEAERWDPGVEGLTFLPYLQGERTPHADPDARGSFTGLSLRHDRGALVRAVLEGVAYGLRDSLELLRELGVAPREGPRVRWGRAKSPLARDRRLGARPAARAHRRRGRIGLRRGDARRSCGRDLRERTTRRSRPACESARRSSRTPAGHRRTRRVTLAFARCIPPCEERRNDDGTGRKGRLRHGREPRHRRRRRAGARERGGPSGTCFPKRGRSRARRLARALLRRAPPRSGRESPSRRPSNASVASTSASRTPVWARTTPSPTRPSSTSRR